MTERKPRVKYPHPFRALLVWIDCHPRTGWYLLVVASANLTLNLLDAADIDPFWFVR